MNYHLLLLLAFIIVILVRIFLPTIQNELYFRKHRKPKSKIRFHENQDKYQILRDQKTNGVNYNITTEDIIDQLKKWEKECSFKIEEARVDRFVLKFDTLPEDMDAFAKEAYKFCPTFSEMEIDQDQIIEDLKEGKILLFWWD